METPGVLILSVPAEFVAKVARAVDEIAAMRAVAIRDLRRLAAQVGWASGVARALGPHAACLWAACSAAE